MYVYVYVYVYVCVCVCTYVYVYVHVYVCVCNFQALPYAYGAAAASFAFPFPMVWPARIEIPRMCARAFSLPHCPAVLGASAISLNIARHVAAASNHQEVFL